MKNLFTRTEIMQGVLKIFPNAQFYLTDKGTLEMSFKGEYVDHSWKKGTFINQ